jgi:hypothetical protein
MGFGTIPDCTGLDHDDFVDPGAEIEIRFQRLGSLRCRFAEPARRCCPAAGRCGRRCGSSMARKCGGPTRR